MRIEVRDLRPSDWPEVARIYREGIETGNATFETEVPSWQEWDAAHLGEHRLVAERDGAVAGWIALVPVSPRECYAGVAEVSAYVGEEARGEGVGSALLTAVVDSWARAAGRDHARVPRPGVRIAVPAEGAIDVHRRGRRGRCCCGDDRGCGAERQRVRRRSGLDDAGRARDAQPHRAAFGGSSVKNTD